MSLGVSCRTGTNKIWRGLGTKSLLLKGPHAHTQRLYIITLKFMANMIIPPTKVNKPQAQVPFHVHHQAQPTHKIYEMRLGDYTLTL